jgi:hypothetical protein
MNATAAKNPCARITFDMPATEIDRRAEVVRLLGGRPLNDRENLDLVAIRETCMDVGAKLSGSLGLALVDALIADGHDLPRLRAEMAADSD